MPASSYVARDHAGGAVDTTISADISTTTQLTINITSAVGWPSGGANGPFHVIVDYDVTGKEKIEIQSRTGTTLTVADTGKRGIDGTSASTHTSGATIRHCYTAIDATEANEHITDTTKDHHTQYLNNARHDIEGRHIFGGAYGSPATPTDIATAAAIGSGNNPAKEDHTHKIGTGAINASGMFGAGVVNSAAIGALAVTAGKLGADSVGNVEILNGQVGTNELADLGVTSGKLAANAVIAGKINAGAIDSTADFASGIFEDTLSNANHFNNVTLGTGGNAFRWTSRLGNMVVVQAAFHLGTGGDVTGEITLNLPYTATSTGVTAAGWLAGARALDADTANAYSGTALIFEGDLTILKSAVLTGSGTSWDNNTPMNWTVSDRFFCFTVYQRA